MVIEVHQGDALRVLAGLPAQAFDAIVTDPPYCSGAFLEAAKGATPGQGLRRETMKRDGFSWFVGDNMTTGGLVWLLRGVGVEAVRLLKPGGHLVVFVDWRMIPALAPAIESAGLRWRSLVVWDKGFAGLGAGFRPRHECALHYTLRTPAFHSRRVSNVLAHKRIPPGRKRHQCEKPGGLLADLLEVTTPAGGVVLDPFAGSGSLGDVAIATGRRAVLVERCPVIFGELCRRFASVANDNRGKKAAAGLPAA